VDVEILEIWIAVDVIVEGVADGLFSWVGVYCDGGGGGGTIFGYHCRALTRM
jgi:hypothetical protein